MTWVDSMTQQDIPVTDTCTALPPALDSTSWTAMERDFTPRTLKCSGKMAVPCLSASAKAMAFGFSLFSVPLLVAAFKLLQADRGGMAGYLLALLGLLSAALPTMLIRMTKTITIDANSGIYYTAQRGIDPVGRKHVEGRLSDIIALQVLDKSIRTSRDSTGDGFTDSHSTFRAFELNLFMRDGTRLHLLDEIDFWLVRRAAEQLSTVLAVPVWHKPGMRTVG